MRFSIIILYIGFLYLTIIAPASAAGPSAVPPEDTCCLNDTTGHPIQRGQSDTASSKIPDLRKITVTSCRNAQERSAVTTLTAEEFAGRFTDLAGVLEQVSGVQVRRTGGFGEYADASIRGSSSKQVRVYLDGIPLNTAGGGAVDLSKLSIGNLREINVYKGTAPLDLMSGSGGAVISLQSGARKDIVNGIAEYGSFGYRKAGMMARKKIGRSTHHVSVDFNGADNDYPFIDNNNTQHNDSDDAIKRKKHNAFTRNEMLYINDWPMDSCNRLTSRFSFSEESQESFHKHLVDTLQLAGYAARSIYGLFRWEQERYNGYLGCRIDGRLKRGLLHDPLGQMHIGGEYKERQNFPYSSLQCDGLHIFNEWLQVKLLVRAGWEGFASENLLAENSSSPPRAHRLSGASAVEFSTRCDRLHYSLRYNHIYVRDSASFTPDHGYGAPLPNIMHNHYPNGNFDLVFHLSDRFSLDGSFRYEFLPVSLSDRYGWGNNYIGNHKLKPERRAEGSVGFTFRNATMRSVQSVFAGTTRDLVELQMNSQRILRADNRGDFLTAGAEWDFYWHPLPFLTIDNHGTFVYKKAYENGSWNEASRLLLYYSPFENDLRLHLSFLPVTGGLSAHYRSPFLKNYVQPLQFEAPPPTMTAFVSVTFLKKITLSYRLENWLDVCYEPINHYTPLPGRMHFLVGRIQFQ